MYNNFFLYRKRYRKECPFLENIYMAGKAFGTNCSNHKAGEWSYDIFPLGPFILGASFHEVPGKGHVGGGVQVRIGP
jgi:hypothetical protein